MFLEPTNAPAFDRPPFVGPGRAYVVASVPRCGSTLLCRALWDTALVGAPKEYLNPTQLRDWELRFGGPVTRLAHRVVWPPLAERIAVRTWSQARLTRYLDRVRAVRTGPTGWFGLKVHHHHLARWEAAGRDPLGFLAPERFIRVVRDDRVAQAVSWVRALQTRRWASHQRARLPSVYRRAWITAALGWIDDGSRGWDAALAGRPVLTVRYEELAADVPGSTRRVLAWLGVPDAPTVVVPVPSIDRQADAVSAAWVARYRAGR